MVSVRLRKYGCKRDIRTINGSAMDSILSFISVLLLNFHILKSTERSSIPSVRMFFLESIDAYYKQ